VLGKEEIRTPTEFYEKVSWKTEKETAKILTRCVVEREVLRLGNGN